MAQDLTVNIKTTSDVPQAMDKAKSATVSFGKQVEDIQKKFSMAFKDIFLSFLGPMALLGVAINYIGKLIEENQKKHREANQAAIDGTNELMSAEDRYYAKKRDNEKKDKENREQAAMSREDITKDFLLNDPIGRAIMQLKGAGDQNAPGFLKALEGVTGGREQQAAVLAKFPEIQSAVQLAIMDQAKKNPIPSEKKDFKGPEGFSNVIGVGPNPVLEAMARQNEIALAQLAELQKISGSTPAGQGDFTKGNQSK
jgi:hypothetical protein